MKLIISQRYVKKQNGAVASLEDFQGDKVLVRSQNGNFETLPLALFKRLFSLV